MKKPQRAEGRRRRRATLRLLSAIIVILTITAETLPLTPKASAINLTPAAAATSQDEPINIPWKDVLEVIDADNTDEALARAVARLVGLGCTEQELITALITDHRELLKQGSSNGYIYEYRTLYNYKDLVTAERIYQASITGLKVERDTRGGVAVKIPVVNLTANSLDTYGVTFTANKPGHLTLKRTEDNMIFEVYVGPEGCVALIPPGTYTPTFTPLNAQPGETTYTTAGDITLTQGNLVINGRGEVHITCETLETTIYILNETALIDVTDLTGEHGEAFNITYGEGQLVKIDGRIYVQITLTDNPDGENPGIIAEITEALDLKHGIDVTIKIIEDLQTIENIHNTTNEILQTLRTTTRKIRIAIAETGDPQQLKNTDTQLKEILSTLSNQEDTSLHTLNRIAQQAQQQLRQIINGLQRHSETTLPDDGMKQFYSECLNTLDQTQTQLQQSNIETQQLLERHTLSIKVTGPGTTEPKPGKHSYLQGDTVDILALPDTASTLKTFRLDGKQAKPGIIDKDGQIAEILTVKMDANHTVEAEFQAHLSTYHTIKLREIEEQSQPTPPSPTPPKPIAEGPLHDPTPTKKTLHIVIWCRPLTTKRTDIHLQTGAPPCIASYYASASIKNYDTTNHRYRLTSWIDKGNQYRYAAFNTGPKLRDGVLLTETISNLLIGKISLTRYREYEVPHNRRTQLRENILVHGLKNAGDMLSAAAAAILGDEGGTPITGLILHIYTNGEWRQIDNEHYGYLIPAVHPAITEVYTQFLDTSFWEIALHEAGQTIANIPGNLATGIQEGTYKWKGELDGLRRSAVAMGGPFKAADFLLNNITQTWLGFNTAIADLFALGIPSGIAKYLETGSMREALGATAPGQFQSLVELAIDPHVKKEERAKHFGKILAYIAIILAAKAASAAIAKAAPKFYRWVFQKPGRVLFLQKTKNLLQNINDYGKALVPGLQAAKLIEKLFTKISGARPEVQDSAIGGAVDEFVDLYGTYLDVYGEEYAEIKAQQLLDGIDDDLRLLNDYANSIQDQVREKLGDEAAKTLQKLAEPYGYTTLTELAKLFNTLNALERADLKLREIKILTEATLINDFMQHLETALIEVPDETTLIVVSQVKDIVDDLTEHGVSLLEIRGILAGAWTQIDTQQIDADTIITTLQTLHEDYLHLSIETEEITKELFPNIYAKSHTWFKHIVERFQIEQGPEKALEIQRRLANIITQAKDKLSPTWYGDYLEILSQQATADLTEAEDMISVIETALSENKLPARVLKASDGRGGYKYRLGGIAKDQLANIFTQQGIEQGDLVRIILDVQGHRFEVFSQVGKIETFVPHLSDAAAPFTNKYGVIQAIEKVTPERFLEIAIERRSFPFELLAREGEWFIEVEGKQFQIDIGKPQSSGNQIYLPASGKGFNLRFYKDGSAGIELSKQQEPQFSTVTEASYDQDIDVLRFIYIHSGERTEVLSIYFGAYPTSKTFTLGATTLLEKAYDAYQIMKTIFERIKQSLSNLKEVKLVEKITGKITKDTADELRQARELGFTSKEGGVAVQVLAEILKKERSFRTHIEPRIGKGPGDILGESGGVNQAYEVVMRTNLRDIPVALDQVSQSIVQHYEDLAVKGVEGRVYEKIYAAIGYFDTESPYYDYLIYEVVFEH